jgi:hypothetical protein
MVRIKANRFQFKTRVTGGALSPPVYEAGWLVS